MPHDFGLKSTNDDRLFRLFTARSRLRDDTFEPVSLDELAGQAGMSSFHFLRLFRKTFGQTPHRLSIEFRLARARTLLIETDMPVTEVCFECGYESLGSFSHLFQKTMGCSPRQYRANRRRFWPINISFPRSFIPSCILDGFRGGSGGKAIFEK